MIRSKPGQLIPVIPRVSAIALIAGAHFRVREALQAVIPGMNAIAFTRELLASSASLEG
jgi:hypothetical protein